MYIASRGPEARRTSNATGADPFASPDEPYFGPPVCSLAGLEDELGASVVGMWNGAASELNGAVITLGD